MPHVLPSTHSDLTPAQRRRCYRWLRAAESHGIETMGGAYRLGRSQTPVPEHLTLGPRVRAEYERGIAEGP